MRKLAREAVIFMLLTSLAVFVGFSIYAFANPSEMTTEIPAPVTSLLGPSLALGMIWGLPVGFGFWAFYRIVRFAIKG